VVVLEDNDVLHIVGGGYGIYKTAQADVEAAVPRRLQLLDMEVDSMMKYAGPDRRQLLRLPDGTAGYVVGMQGGSGNEALVRA
jgi:hypothetical protein